MLMSGYGIFYGIFPMDTYGQVEQITLRFMESEGRNQNIGN